VNAGAGSFYASSRQHLGLYVYADAGFYIGGEADSERSRSAADVDQPRTAGATLGTLEALASRDLAKKAGRVGLAVSGIKRNGRIEAAHVLSIGILTKP
jgi:hypothetical protein